MQIKDLAIGDGFVYLMEGSSKVKFYALSHNYESGLNGKELTLPVAVDVEDNKLKQLSTLDLSNLTAYALEQVEKMGFYAQLYTYTSYANAHLDMARLSGRWDVWLADYTGKPPKVSFKYNAHQHTSSGNVPGISGNVDLNVTTLNYPRIIRKKGLTRLREGK